MSRLIQSLKRRHACLSREREECLRERESVRVGSERLVGSRELQPAPFMERAAFYAFSIWWSRGAARLVASEIYRRGTNHYGFLSFLSPQHRVYNMVGWLPVLGPATILTSPLCGLTCACNTQRLKRHCRILSRCLLHRFTSSMELTVATRKIAGRFAAATRRWPRFAPSAPPAKLCRNCYSYSCLPWQLQWQLPPVGRLPPSQNLPPRQPVCRTP